ncbi:MAG: PKD domain-containing protein, partial [Flavobacteriales bacterium]
DLYWACCWMAGFGGNSIYIEFETSNGWEPVFSAGGNVTECTFLPGTGIIDPDILSDAITFGAGTIHGHLYATDNCVAGWGCSGFTDPAVTGLTLTYDAHAANFTTTDQSICPGETVQFTDASINTPSSYEWTFPGGIPASSSLQNPVVQYGTPGSWDVTLIVVTADGPDTLVMPGYITVNALPPANAGVDEDVCIGTPAQLQASGGTSYQWFPPDHLDNDLIASPLALPSVTTIYTVLVTDANGCEASDFMILTVHELPTVAASAGNNTICLGDTANIIAVGAQLYQWSPNLFISSTSGASVFAWPTSTFTWTVTGTDFYGCVNDTTVTLTVQPPPPAPMATINGTEVTSTPANGYQWYLNGVAIGGATQQSWTPVLNGNYSVMITDANGCSSQSLPVFFGNVGIAAVGAVEGILIFPLPAAEAISVTGLRAGDVLTVMDASGRLVREARSAQSTQVNIDIRDLSAGTYVLEVVGNGTTQRIMVPKR